MKQIKIPQEVGNILETFENAGFKAYVVGGCVRDSFMDRPVNDWDICTSALPEEIQKVFQGAEMMLWGMKHGTVSVKGNHKFYEITTYRIDGEYRDNRHPDRVKFARNIDEDLKRRDFTINAMAYNKRQGLIDLFGGQMDIINKTIRAVGNPEKRFAEDGLRIMRALRFSATLGFTLEKNTGVAADSHKNLLKNISRERINEELSKLIMGNFADEVLVKYKEIIETATETKEINVVKPMSTLPENLPIRLANLFQDNTEEILRKLKFSNEITGCASKLAEIINLEVPENTVEIKQFIRKYGLEIAGLYFEANGKAGQIEEILENGDCISMGQLAVNGLDLQQNGMTAGPLIGKTLDAMLDAVIKEKIENDKEKLLKAFL